MWSVKCGVWSGKCEVWSVKWGVWSVKCGVRSVKCRVWSVECKVWSVQCGVRRFCEGTEGWAPFFSGNLTGHIPCISGVGAFVLVFAV